MARASWRAASASGPTSPRHSTPSTASKRNEAMAALSRASTVSWVESRTGAGALDALGRIGPVSRPRSSNRTCGFPASGSPTGFIPHAVAGGGPRCIRRRRTTPNLPNTTRSLNCRVPRDDTFLRLLRFEIKLLLQVEIFYGVSDSCQSPALLCLRSVPEGRALRSPGVTRLPRYYGPVRLPAGSALLAENGGVASSTRRDLPSCTAVSLG